MNTSLLSLLLLICIHACTAANRADDLNVEEIFSDREENHADQEEKEAKEINAQVDCPCSVGTKQLDCSNKGWNRTPDINIWLGKCADTLVSLNLASNKLTSMPFQNTNNEMDVHGQILEGTIRLPKLKSLDLSDNHLDSEKPEIRSTYSQIQERPGYLARWFGISDIGFDINLSGNKLKTLEFIGSLSLEEFGEVFPVHGLQLKGNFIYELPKNIDSLERIKWMDLEGDPVQLGDQDQPPASLT